MVERRDAAPDPETCVALRAEAGLGRRSVGAAAIGPGKSLACLTAWDESRIVAMGRLVEDSGWFTRMVDIMVRPDVRRRGPGAGIAERLPAWGHDDLPETCLIGLRAAPGAEGCYAARGFRVFTGMILNVGPG